MESTVLRGALDMGKFSELREVRVMKAAQLIYRGEPHFRRLSPFGDNKAVDRLMTGSLERIRVSHRAILPTPPKGSHIFQVSLEASVPSPPSSDLIVA